VKSVRPIAVAEHLWATFERMAEEMGSDPEALVNQAMHAFAQRHGYLGTSSPTPPRSGAEDPGEGQALREHEDPERLAVAERVLETAARLERSIHEAPSAPPSARLVLVRADGIEQPVTKERFVIGRGRHCDLVIDSGKVSRETMACSRDDLGWSIVDLGSSNGTWHHREKISRRRIEDGDEYFIGSERIRCVLR
jgi:hypothetical protein